MKRALIVTSAGVGAALLASLVAVASAGLEPGATVLSTALTLAIAVVAAVTFLAGVLLAEAGLALGAIGAYFVVGIFLGVWGDFLAVPLVGVGGAVAAHFFCTRTARKWRKARMTAVARIARRKEAAESNRTRLVADATETIPTPWLIDAFDARESTPRDDMLAELDADTAWALARLHRKGVPAEYVAARWRTGQPLDADALVASYRAGGAA